METINESELLLFEKPCRILLSGFSGSGKSYFTSQLIRKYRHKFSKVIVLGSDLENVSDLNIIRNDKYNPFEEEEDKISHKLIIFDDLLFNPSALKLASELFVRGRHLNYSCFFLSQNLYTSDKNFRVLSLNSTHVILFKMRDLNQIRFLAKTFLSNSQIENFISLYKKIVLKQNHGYILIDYNKDADSILRIRTSVVNEGYERVFEI